MSWHLRHATTLRRAHAVLVMGQRGVMNPSHTAPLRISMSPFCAGWDFSSKLGRPSQHPAVVPSISYRPFWVDTKLAENQPRYGPSGRESAGSVLDLEVATRHLTQPASRCRRASARSHLVSRKKNGFCRLSIFLPLPILRSFSRSLVSHMSGVFLSVDILSELAPQFVPNAR